MKHLLREEANDGTQGGTGGTGGQASNNLDPSKWKAPDDGTNDGGSAGTGKTQAELDAEAAVANAGTGGIYTPSNELWTELQKVDGFKMPDGITKENELEILKKALVDSKLAEIDPADSIAAKAVADKYAGLDPETASFMRFKETNPQATMVDFVNQKNQITNLVSLPDKDFMKEHLLGQYGSFDKDKNPDGLTDQEIEDAISALETNKQLPLEAKKLKAEYRKYDAEQKAAGENNIQQADTSKKDKVITDMKSDLQKLFGETKKITELSGIKVSEADLNNINSAFEKAVLPNEKGEVAIVQMLQSDNLLWNFFALNYLGDEKFKGAFTTAKESTKDQILKKLGLKPINAGGRQADSGKKNVITPGLWSIPEAE